MNQATATATVSKRDIARLSYRVLPILDGTRQALRDLGRGMAMSTTRFAEVAQTDPGLALQLLQEANVQANNAGQMDVVGVAHAVSLLGMEQTLGLVSRQRSLDTIKSRRRRDGLLHAMGRAAHASGLARRWSRRRGEQAAEVAGLAVFVRHAAELVLWAGDAEAVEFFARLHHAGADRMRIERELLGDSLQSWGEQLAVQAQVPAQLRAAVFDESALSARLAPCVLASALAESAAVDWHSQRSTELITLYAELSGNDTDAAVATLHSQTAHIARLCTLGRSMSAARYLLLPPGDHFEAEELALPAPAPMVVASNAAARPRGTDSPLAPPVVSAEQSAMPPARSAAEGAADLHKQPTPPISAQTDEAPRSPPPAPTTPMASSVTPVATPDPETTSPAAPSARETPVPSEGAVVTCQQLLGDTRRGTTTIQAALPGIIDALRDGFGFERVVFALKDREQPRLVSRYTSGEPAKPALEVDLARPSLVTRLLQGPQGIWLHDGTRDKFWSFLPRSVRAYAGERDFCLVSLFVRDKGVGIIYADYRGAHVDEQAYARFKRMALQVADSLTPRRKGGT